MEKIPKLILCLIKVLLIGAVVLFVIYFWNLDRKFLNWVYKKVDTGFCRKRTDQAF